MTNQTQWIISQDSGGPVQIRELGTNARIATLADYNALDHARRIVSTNDAPTLSPIRSGKIQFVRIEGGEWDEQNSEMEIESAPLFVSNTGTVFAEVAASVDEIPDDKTPSNEIEEMIEDDADTEQVPQLCRELWAHLTRAQQSAFIASRSRERQICECGRYASDCTYDESDPDSEHHDNG